MPEDSIERHRNPREGQARSWLVEYLKDPDQSGLYKGYAVNRCRGRFLQGRHKEIIAEAGERVFRLVLKVLLPPKNSESYFRMNLRDALNHEDEKEFKRLIHKAFLNCIKWSALDVIRDEWEDAKVTDELDEERVPDAVETADEAAASTAVAKLWLEFLERKKSEARLDSQKRKLQAVIELEELDLSGEAHGRQPEIAKKFGVSVSSIQHSRKDLFDEFAENIRKEGL